MKKMVPTFKDLPFEEGKVYKTKFSTGESFKVTKIIIGTTGINKGKIIGFNGVYEGKYAHLGVCPLGGDRLISERVKNGEEVCDKCGTPIGNEQ